MHSSSGQSDPLTRIPRSPTRQSSGRRTPPARHLAKRKLHLAVHRRVLAVLDPHPMLRAARKGRSRRFETSPSSPMSQAPRGINIERFRDPDANWSRQFQNLGFSGLRLDLRHTVALGISSPRTVTSSPTWPAGTGFVPHGNCRRDNVSRRRPKSRSEKSRVTAAKAAFALADYEVPVSED
jgi:hypothetical protein